MFGAACRILRIHYLDIEESADLVHKAVAKEGAFIALSPAFADVSWVQDGNVWSYKSQLGRLLKSPAAVDTDGMSWFSPLTL